MIDKSGVRKATPNGPASSDSCANIQKERLLKEANTTALARCRHIKMRNEASDEPR
ncbi:hypothetical protein A343_1616 [Porphyromonas gingivalis JCVI SC001]|nr:hypothetical protein A343_1616 [Porphyromonas gingivalis JCVI SC001]